MWDPSGSKYPHMKYAQFQQDNKKNNTHYFKFKGIWLHILLGD